MKLLYIKDKNSPVSLIDSSIYNLKEVLFESEIENIQNFVESLSEYEFDGIIISDKLGINYIGLEICLRIRLSGDVLKEKSFCSFFIYITSSVEVSFRDQLATKQHTSASLYLTRGAFSFDNKEMLEILIQQNKNFNLLNQVNFNEFFLNLIILKRPDDFGNHSLANIWGVYKLAIITGNEDSIILNEKQRKIKNDLYFMWLKAFYSFSPSKIAFPKKIIPSKSKKILLIDDEEDKGWSELLTQVFESSDFNFIKYSSRFFEDIQIEINKKNSEGLPLWDLILLDLRLDETEDRGEKSQKVASEYSGAIILKDIKKINPGIQVVMFTASNKAWNMKELIDLGADGYYIKESPQVNLNNDFSLKNFEGFEKQVIRCFENSILKKLFHVLKPLKILLNEESKKRPGNCKLQFIQQGRVLEIHDQIMLSEKLIKDYTSELRWGFLNLILIIEQIIKDSYVGDEHKQVVEIDLFNTITCAEKVKNNLILSLTPIGKKYTLDKFIVPYDEQRFYSTTADRVPFNFRLTCVLHFKYSLPLDSSIFKFHHLYQLRSDSVAHSGVKSVLFKDMLLVIELLNILIK